MFHFLLREQCWHCKWTAHRWKHMNSYCLHWRPVSSSVALCHVFGWYGARIVCLILVGQDVSLTPWVKVFGPVSTICLELLKESLWTCCDKSSHRWLIFWRILDKQGCNVELVRMGQADNSVVVIVALFVLCVCADRDRVSTWCFRRWEEEMQHRDGAHHISVSAVPGWTNHRTGFQHCKLHHQSAAKVLHYY